MVTTTEFVQGKTWRWGIGWSFDLSLKTKVNTVACMLHTIIPSKITPHAFDWPELLLPVDSYPGEGSGLIGYIYIFTYTLGMYYSAIP